MCLGTSNGKLVYFKTMKNIGLIKIFFLWDVGKSINMKNCLFIEKNAQIYTIATSKTEISQKYYGWPTTGTNWQKILVLERMV